MRDIMNPMSSCVWVFMKKCSSCKNEKEHSEFYDLKNRPGKLSSRCIDCSKIKSMESYNRRYLEKEGSKDAREQRSRINDARAAGGVHFIPVIPCPKGHLSKRLVSTQQCCKCLVDNRRGRGDAKKRIEKKTAEVKRITSKNLGKKYYFTGIECKNGHVSNRLVSTRQCVDCLKSRSSKRDSPHVPSDEEKRRRNAKRRRPESRAKQRKYQKDVLFKRTSYRLAVFCRSAVSRISGFKKVGRTSKALGYTKEGLMKRMEVQFKAGMSWDNYGEWHIDHKKPISRFSSQGISDPKIINSLSNLQPMWARENLSKGDKFILK